MLECSVLAMVRVTVYRWEELIQKETSENLTWAVVFLRRRSDALED